MHFRPAARSRVARWGAMVVAATAGLAVERGSDGWSEPVLWVPDLAVGLVLVAAGLVVWTRQPATSALLGLAAGGWFLGTLWPVAIFLHVGVIVHLLVTLPAWRPRSLREACAVLVGYGAALTLPLWQSDFALAGVTLGLVLVLARGLVRPRGRAGRHRLVALRAGAGLATVLLLGALARLLLPSGVAVVPVLLLYELSVCSVAVALVLVLRGPRVGVVTDLVVELGDMRSGTLQDALATTLGDPSLEVGHLTAAGQYVDAYGARVLTPTTGDGRAATLVEREGGPFAMLVHDATVLDEPALVAAVAAATRLAESHTTLRTDVDVRLVELDESRRRLLVAADDERARLERRLRNGAERRLESVDALLRSAAARAATPTEHIDRARCELAHTLDDLHALAQGLRPRELDRGGLHGALRALAGRSPLPLDLHVPDERYDPDVEATAWFVCAEAVANAVKHASATRASVVVSHPLDALVVTLLVADDGGGGADPSRGTGLRGMADRVAASGGSLRLVSPTAGGTRVTADLPLRRHPV